MQYPYFDYGSKREVIYNGVSMGYFIDTHKLFEQMGTKWDFIEKIYVISLDHRDDRRQILHDNLRRIGIQKVTYFVPIKFANLSLADKIKLNGVFYWRLDSEPLNPTVMACFISHLICYKDAHKQVQKNCMILEDDCVIRDIPDNMLQTIEKFVRSEKYAALYMHHGQLPLKFKFHKLLRNGSLKAFDFKRLELEKRYPGIRVFLGAGLAHCIIFSKDHLHVLDDMKINYKGRVAKNLDYILHRQASQYDFYTTQIQYTTQMPGFSDITGTLARKGY